MISNLKKIVWGLCCAGLMSTGVAYADDNQFDQLVVFGDSLSDSGNLYQTTQIQHFNNPDQNKIMPNSNYYRGHFSNGDTWIETLSVTMNLPLADFAYGGAWVESDLYSGDDITPNLNKQVQNYLEVYKNDQHRDKHLYFIWAGANDYLHSALLEKDVNEITDRVKIGIETAASTLIKAGAKHIIILGLPQLGNTALSKQNPFFLPSDILNQMSDLHNQKLIKLVNYLSDPNDKSKDIRFFDIATPLNEIMAAPEKYNLKVVNDGCITLNILNPAAAMTLKSDFSKNPILALAAKVNSHAKVNGGCDIKKSDQNPDDYIFWDGLHPTRVVHNIIAQKMFDEINKPLN